MHPRKKESKKWSLIPAEFSGQIQTVFEQNFQNFLKDQSIKVQGRIYPTEIVLRVGLHKKGELRHRNFEVSLDHSSVQQNTIQKIHLAVDAIGSLMIEYFEAEETVDLPYVWREVPFEKEAVYFQFTTENPDLEEEANKLLGATKNNLINEDENEDEDNENGHEVESDLDLTTPQIFKSNPKKKKGDLH